MVSIPFPLNTAPGYLNQDGAGRLINVYAEQRQNEQGIVWRRAPGATYFTTVYPTTTAMTGTATVSWGGQNRQGLLAVSGSGSATFVGST